MPERKSAIVIESRFPGYDVLSKRLTPSWNEKTREVVTRRLRDRLRTEILFVAKSFKRFAPSPTELSRNLLSRPPISVAALVDDKLHQRKEDGYRLRMDAFESEAWRRGLKALDEEATQAFGARFHDLSAQDQDALLARMEHGSPQGPGMGRHAVESFFHDALGARHCSRLLLPSDRLE